MRMETGKRIVQSWNAKSPLEQEAACRRSSNFSMKDSSRKCSWKIQKGKLQELQITRKLKNMDKYTRPTWTNMNHCFSNANNFQRGYVYNTNQICSFSFENLSSRPMACMRRATHRVWCHIPLASHVTLCS